MKTQIDQRHIVKFFVVSALCMVLGSIHGTLQVFPPIKQWLNLIGTPLTYPGRLIDPLAHAHLTVIGGLFIFAMGAMYMLTSLALNKEIYSKKLVDQSFWWTTIGMFFTYSTFMFFGVVEGFQMIENPAEVSNIHDYFPPIISLAGTTLSIGFIMFFTNIILSLRRS